MDQVTPGRIVPAVPSPAPINLTPIMNTQHTPGSWYWEVNPHSKSLSLRAPQRGGTIVMDFVRYGMRSAQPRFRVGNVMEKASDLSVVDPERDHHKAWHQLLEHPDARLIAAAPDLLEAVKALLATGLNGGNNVRLAYMAAKQTVLSDEELAKADKAEEALQMAYAAIKKATQTI